MASDKPGRAAPRREAGAPRQPQVVIASILRDEGPTGVQTHVREVRHFLDRQGIETALVTPFSWSPALHLPIFAVRPALSRFNGAAGVAWYRHWHEEFLRQALRKELNARDDVVIYAQGPEAARACLRARSGTHQKVVMAVHYQASQAEGWASKGLISRAGRSYGRIVDAERKTLQDVDGLVYVSGWARDQLLTWLPQVADLPSLVVPNFVQPLELPATREPRGDLVTVGSLDFAKQHVQLLRVLAEAKRLGYIFTLDIYGDGPLREHLLATARSLEVDQQVRFRGYCPDVRQVLPGYRAYVHACLTETGPIAVIEAMAAGLPILAPAAGGIVELFADNVEGRYWSPQDPPQAAETLIAMLSSPADLAKFGRASQQRFRHDFQTDVVGPRLVRFFETMPGNGPPSRKNPKDAPREGPSAHRPRPKAILICYCCEPGEGSESGAGWTWAQSASEIADVVLIISGALPDNVARVRQAIADLELPITLHTVGGVVRNMSFLNDGFLGRLNYSVWQARAGRHVRRLERQQQIDIVHHVTFATDSLPSALTASKALVRIWGPVGGATKTSPGLYRYMTPRGTLDAIVRDVVNAGFRAVFGDWVAKRATLIVAMNHDGERRWRHSAAPVIVESNVALRSQDFQSEETFPPVTKPGNERVALFVSNLLPFKGLQLAVRALQLAPGWRLVVFGDGPDQEVATRLAQRLQVSDRLEFHGRVPRSEVLSAFRTADALLFPSFHDSASWAVGEAAAFGCPVVCLDAGGPAFVAGRSAHVVPVKPARSLPERIAEELNNIDSRRTPADHLLADRIPALLKTWYTMSHPVITPEGTMCNDAKDHAGI